MKKNCWEVKECGREPGGKNAIQYGICPAATKGKLDGTHCGMNAGRCCWIVDGTTCDGNPNESFAKKFYICEQCEFYQNVKNEEYPEFIPMALLLKRL